MNRCDHNHQTMLEVRLLPTSAGPMHGNLILCYRHFVHELASRARRGWEVSPEFNPYPKWEDLKVYEEE